MLSILAADKISKVYNKRKVVQNVSISIKQGEIVGLLGPNGSGKTTCFNIISGLIHTKSGKLSIDNQDITSLSMHVRSKLGINYLPQEPSIFPSLSVEDNIVVVLESNKVSKKQVLTKVHALLDQFHILHLKDEVAGSLSGGERRRLEIARTIANYPKFILLDEPFLGVDPITVEEIKNIILQLKNNGIGIFITDHGIYDLLDIIDRSYVIYDGKIITSGLPEEVINDKRTRDLYLGSSFKIGYNTK